MKYQMIKAMNHVGISVRNIERSVAFYRDLFGMDVIIAPAQFDGEIYETIMGIEGASGRLALLEGSGMQLELFEFAHPAPRAANDDRPVSDQGISHFCIEVADIESEYRRLQSHGVSFHCVPQCFGRFGKATYGRDPDGNVFELLELAQGASS